MRARRKPAPGAACGPGRRARSTAARWRSCASRSGAVGLLSAARIVAYGWIDPSTPGPRHRFTYLGFGWVPQPTASQMRGLRRRCWRWRRWPSCSAGAPAGAPRRSLREPRVDRADRRHHLPQPLLVPHPGRRRWRWWRRWGGALSLDARRAGGPATVARGLGVAVPLPGRRGLRLRRAGQAAARLAGARPAARAVAARPGPACPVLGRLVGIDGDARTLFAIAGAAFDCLIVPLLLWRRTRLRGVARAGRVPRVHLGAVPDRGVPVADDRRVDGLLRARLAPSPARPRSGGPVAVPRVAPVRRSPVLLALAVAVGGRPARPAAPPPRLPRRPPLDAARATASPGTCCSSRRRARVTFLVHEPSTGRDLGGRPEPSSTRAPSCGSWPPSPTSSTRPPIAIAADERPRGREVEVRVDAWVSLNGRPAAAPHRPDRRPGRRAPRPLVRRLDPPRPD